MASESKDPPKPESDGCSDEFVDATEHLLPPFALIGLKVQVAPAASSNNAKNGTQRFSLESAFLPVPLPHSPGTTTVSAPGRTSNRAMGGSSVTELPSKWAGRGLSKWSSIQGA